MKKFTSLLMGLSLALAGAALAQQPESTESPAKVKGKQHAETAQGAQGEAGANAEAGAGGGKKRGAGKGAKAKASENMETNAASPGATAAAQGETKAERRAARKQKNEATPKTDAAASTETNASGQAGASATPNEKQVKGKGKHGRGANANANVTASPNASPAASVGAASEQNQQTNVAAGGKKKKAEPQKIEQIKQQHASFRAQPKPDKVPPVTFNVNYRIEGSDRWQGPQYEVFRSYHPERRDQGWYRSHYTRVELIGGGYYYWNNGYWYPAWGYNSANEYYPYDGPIYVGHRAEPPDRVIADVQAELQEMGYYQGEVDGLLGPLTRQALRDYQSDQGLIATSVIDEPTLDALGMG